MTLNDLIEALAATPPVLARLVRGLPEETLRRGHGDDRWSIKEVLGHLRDNEQVFLGRYEQILHEEQPRLEAYDQEEMARGHDYQRGDAAAALAGFVETRAAAVALFQRLTAADLGRSALHDDWGPVTLGWLAEHIVAHDLAHLAQISRTLD